MEAGNEAAAAILVQTIFLKDGHLQGLLGEQANKGAAAAAEFLKPFIGRRWRWSARRRPTARSKPASDLGVAMAQVIVRDIEAKVIAKLSATRQTPRPKHWSHANQDDGFARRDAFGHGCADYFERPLSDLGMTDLDHRERKLSMIALYAANCS